MCQKDNNYYVGVHYTPTLIIVCTLLYNNSTSEERNAGDVARREAARSWRELVDKRGGKGSRQGEREGMGWSREPGATPV